MKPLRKNQPLLFSAITVATIYCASLFSFVLAFVTKLRGSFGSLGTGASTTTTSQGWYPVAPNECQVIYAGNANDVVAIAAQDGTGRFWSEFEGDEYCLHPGNRFSFTNEAHYSREVCRSQGGFTGSFIRVGAASRFYSYSFL